MFVAFIAFVVFVAFVAFVASDGVLLHLARPTERPRQRRHHVTGANKSGLQNGLRMLFPELIFQKKISLNKE